MEFRITLDREAFKVLASDTRLDILKALDERPMTVSELGRRLELNKATVFEHLEKLVGAGLVKKHDEERKWVYYSLSWKARRILHPERVTIALFFSTGLGALLSGVVVAGEYLRRLGLPRGVGESDGALEAPAPAEPSAGIARDAAPTMEAAAQGDATLLYAALALFALVAILAGIALYTWRQARAREAREAAQPPAPTQGP